MRIKFTKEFPTNLASFKVGDVYDVVEKKEPDKYKNYTRYQIRMTEVQGKPLINIAEMFVEEVGEEGRSH